uniref:Uncharacterized protein n=1 Tax=Arundo donax TaxID=35708 RepID=A0A0A9FJJ5_ARUDO
MFHFRQPYKFFFAFTSLGRYLTVCIYSAAFLFVSSLWKQFIQHYSAKDAMV